MYTRKDGHSDEEHKKALAAYWAEKAAEECAAHVEGLIAAIQSRVILDCTGKSFEYLKGAADALEAACTGNMIEDCHIGVHGVELAPADESKPFTAKNLIVRAAAPVEPTEADGWMSATEPTEDE